MSSRTTLTIETRTNTVRCSNIISARIDQAAEWSAMATVDEVGKI
jgi:hypothetical protein